MRHNNHQTDWEYDWQEVIDKWRRYILNGESAPGPVIKNRQENTDDRSRWLGCTKEQLDEHISKGYEFPGLPENLLPDAGEGEGDRWYYTDDSSIGEYQYDMDEAGEMEYYLARKQTKTKPGIRLLLNVCFSAGEKPETIRDYGEWVGSLIQTLENNDYDLEVSMVSRNDRCVTGKGQSNFFIRVSKFGEVVFFSDWSVFFAPGGYRHLVHLTNMLPEEQGETVNSGLGQPVNQEWKIHWDKETRTMEIENAGWAGSFPKEDMSKQLLTIKEQIED